MNRLLMASLLGSALLAPRLAAASESLCFERIYDENHLQKHKLQEVTKIRLRLSSGGTITGDIAAAFRESQKYSGGDVECRETGKVTSCEIIPDGGTFDFTETEKGIRLVNTSSMRFGDEEDGIGIGQEPEHRLFLLFKTDIENCSN